MELRSAIQTTGFSHPVLSTENNEDVVPCGNGSPVRRRAIVSEDPDGVDM